MWHITFQGFYKFLHQYVTNLKQTVHTLYGTLIEMKREQSFFLHSSISLCEQT